MQNRYKKIFLSLAVVFFVLFPQVSLAQKQGLQKAFGEGSPLADVKGRAGYSDEDIGTISGRVVNTALTLVGIIFLLLMVYAGYLWMTARGEESQINKALDIVKGTVIGLVLVMSAYAITVFVTRGLNPTAAPTASAGRCNEQTPAAPAPCAGNCATFTDLASCSPSCCTWTPTP